MELISDIINELIDTDKSISSPLLKTKVLAHRIQNQELYDWASNELSGYNPEKNLPSYRERKGKVVGTFINGNMQYTNQPLLTGGLEEELGVKFDSFNFNQSITSLEKLIAESEEGRLESGYSAEIISLISNYIQKMGNPYFQVINAKTVISTSAVTDIVSIIRNNLLDFMLKIDAEFGSLTEIEGLKSKNKEVSEIMQHTIINANGDGNVINTGDNANIQSKIVVTKGDKESLSNYLESIGIEIEDALELVEIVEQENIDTDGNFGTKTKEWVSRMISKSLDGTWHVGINAAGALLADAINAFYT